MRQIYGIGETVLDIIFKDGQPAAAKAGGSILNAMVSLGRLGAEVRFISEYGKDQAGGLIDQFLADNHVSTRYVTRYDDGQSTLALAFLDQNNNASYDFYKNPSQKRLTNLPDQINEQDILSFGSLYAINPDIREQLLSVLMKARSGGALVYYDPNFRPAHLSELDQLKPVILENMDHADVVRGSDEDFGNIFNARNSDEAYASVNQHCSNMIYTANREGVYVHTAEDKYFFPVRSIKPVSTIGAGDNFNAGALWSIIRQDIFRGSLGHLDHEHWQCMINSATALAAHVCMSYENYISREFAEGFLK